MKGLLAIILGAATFVSGIFGGNKLTPPQTPSPSNQIVMVTTSPATSYTQEQLLAMASNPPTTLPLGDNKYVTNGAKKGYIYLCRTTTDEAGGGAEVTGNWIHNATWTPSEKVHVSGAVNWPQAKFSQSQTSAIRTLTSNGFPTGYTTGIFPIKSTDAAYHYDRNPNSITAQNLTYTLPLSPQYSDTPYCMGGEVGIMNSGVPLFNGFDAQLRDAVAHEVQDTCDGHPQKDGEYHYHGLSSCFKDISETTVLGYALDGFPITGPKVAENKYLTTDNLDECHGITSEIIADGQKKVMYHYVLTQDFPYSVSCFRGKPITTGPSAHSMNQNQARPSGQANSLPNQGRTPPQEAITACANKSAGTTCSFTSPRGDAISGTCATTPQGSACVPARQP